MQDGSVTDLSNLCGQEQQNNSQSPELSAEDFSSLGKKNYAAGFPLEAIESFSRAIAIDPSNDEYYIRRAYAYLLVEDYESARADYRTLVQRNQETNPEMARHHLYFLRTIGGDYEL